MSRADVLQAIMQDKTNVLKDMSNNALKAFIRRYIDLFTDSEQQRTTMFRLLKDSQLTANEVLAQAGAPHVQLVTVTVKQAFDLVYDPLSSTLARTFVKQLADNRGMATLICVTGKRAVILTNVSGLVRAADYYATKSMPQATPDIFVLTLDQAIKHNIKVNQ